MNEQTYILSVNNLEVGFDLPEGRVLAVKNASFKVPRGSTVALVGESGSGKSVISQAIMGLLPPQASISRGSIELTPSEKTLDIAKLNNDSPAMREIRGKFLSIIFQEPMTSLSPLHTVGDQITEALLLHKKISTKQAEYRVCEMLKLVGFPNAQRALKTYPFELSGGLRQRAMIAMALICRPSLLIADEPTTALDVTIQAQILKLMNDLQTELEMAILMITHDLGVVANIADDVVVMYRGEIMESGSRNDIFRNPEHPYLKSLMTAVPRFGMKSHERLIPIREVNSEFGNLIKHDHVSKDIKKQAPREPLLTISGVTKAFSIRSAGLLSKDQDMVRAVNDDS